ncbi:MAG: hypothetical protein WC645_00860 [Candidatus Margulisiibacteriota bacterium]
MKYTCKSFSMGFCIKDDLSRRWYKGDSAEISEQTARQAIDLIPKLVSPAWLDKEIKMLLRLDFGRGESLLKLPLLKNIYDYASKSKLFCNPHFITTTVYTDGSGLSDEAFAWLNKTADKVLNAAALVFVVESGKIDLSSIEKYREQLTANPCINTAVRYFITDLDADLLGDIKTLSDFGFNRLYLNPVHLNHELRGMWKDTDKFLSFGRKLVDYYVANRDTAWTNGIFPLTEMHNFTSRSELWHDTDEEIRCAFYEGQLIESYVMPDGSIYTCSKAHLLGDELKLGSVRHGINRDKIEYAKANMKIGCKCYVSDVCFKGCYILHKLLSKKGLVDNPRTDIHCLLRKTIFRKLQKHKVI